ncbi:MAG TPA: aspartate--tRNA ligase [Candidatus Enterousia avicola]|uniref:Aspartate--tRNA(Asp/Asn) ligase n=1 Tax=Candidatus Enterousia avicola TaxID=2840787 RepID=A0A9D1MSX1_9PROT|nr:aspartate--tRNA ligase [Candidatus Enterousia avicola]
MLSLKSKYRTHTCGELNKSNVGEVVTLSGWVHRKRDHGALLFVDLRDNYGITQCVFDGGDEALEKVRPESVIKITGTVVARAEDAINDKIPTGEIEIKADSWEVLTNADVLPFQVFGDDDSVSEDLRLKYRYLDLRRESLHRNILMRNRMIKFIRDRMWEMGFSEFQTPILTASSPEGARDFIVPSRIHHGMFYALPQAPQQFKQLLQISGFDRYFQIAPCFRDEDLRADRLLEFYQLDLEMSFVDLPDIQAVGNTLMPAIIKEFVPDAKICPDIPHIPFDEAMLKYGSDKPDLRNPIIISDVTEIFRGSDFGIFANAIEQGAVVRAIPAPNSSDKPRSWFDKLGDYAVKELGLGGLGYIVFADEAKGPVAKKLDSERIAKLREISGDKSSLFFICDKEETAAKAAGKLRNKLGEDLGLIDPKEFRLCWIEAFPFFEEDEESPTGLAFTHNPFSFPMATLEELKTKDPLSIKAAQFDMVLNGAEICSGGLRNYNPEVMLRCFEITGYDEEIVKQKFGGMYTAFQYGAPPHGGCAFGLDRLVQIMLAEPNLREVVAFPTNQRGQDLMMGSPSEVTEKQLREVHIQVRKKG